MSSMAGAVADHGRFMELPQWDNRSIASSSMLNPPLMATVIAAAANRYEDQSGDSMPWELLYLVVPMALHRDTREVIPNRINSHLPRWVERNPVLQAGLAPRARSLAPYAREGLRFGLHSGAITLHADATLSGQIPGRLDRDGHPELTAIVGTASFLGKWFAHVGRPATVFAVLGVSP